MSVTQTQQILADYIVQSISQDTQDFQWDVFFRLWFREKGGPFFFLFKRHLGVTNTQYVELFSLLQVYCTDRFSGAPKAQFLFHTTEQMKSTMVDMINMLLDSPSDQRAKQATLFAETYGEVLASTVAVDMFYCSCAVFLPPGIDLDVVQLCGDAGYIHSAGRSVFVRNIKKAKYKDFDAGLRHHLATTSLADFPLPFVIYAHEDFSDYDRDARDQISRGIEHTKLHVEKMSMGVYRLAQIVFDMRKSFQGMLDIPEPGSYKLHDFNTNKSLWLICDRSISSSNTLSAGSERYYICYEQVAKNENPFFFFDENKPAWRSHTTLPHSLAAALINSTRPHSANAQLSDPFGGTGTTWFEAKRLRISTNALCSDLSQALPLMIRDNLNFFLKSAKGLQDIVDQLKRINQAIKSDRKGMTDEDAQRTFNFGSQTEELSGSGPYLYAVGLLNDLKHDQPHEDQEFTLRKTFVDHLARLAPITRLLFYVVLRAELRYQGGYKRRSVTFDKAFTASLQELIDQTEQFIEVRAAMEAHDCTVCGNHVTYQGAYSTVVIPKFFRMSDEDLSETLVKEVVVRDACKLDPLSTDVIICDPPYGFNTTQDQAALARLYSDFLDSALLALRDNGHLIICLPAESYTGRELPYCTRSNLISNQVLTKAKQLGREIFVPARSVPSRAFLPPYYWEAERALRRVILHFRVKVV